MAVCFQGQCGLNLFSSSEIMKGVIWKIVGKLRVRVNRWLASTLIIHEVRIFSENCVGVAISNWVSIIFIRAEFLAISDSCDITVIKEKHI